MNYYSILSNKLFSSVLFCTIWFSWKISNWSTHLLGIKNRGSLWRVWRTGWKVFKNQGLRWKTFEDWISEVIQPLVIELLSDLWLKKACFKNISLVCSGQQLLKVGPARALCLKVHFCLNWEPLITDFLHCTYYFVSDLYTFLTSPFCIDH